jgi:SH3 domain-containing YSC84-like protein 1
MKTVWSVLTLVAMFATVAFTQSDNRKGSTERERVKNAGEVLTQILDASDSGIPGSVLNGAKCVIVLPSVKKMAVGIGGSYGRGVMTCRSGADYKGPWSAPIMMASSGGNIGLQIGGEATDFVIIATNDSAVKSLLKSKVKLGADASVAAGPVGRTAEASTNERLDAQMLSYSRAKGVFGGVSLSGATLRSDGDANEHLYSQKVSAEEIMAGKVQSPPEAQQLIAELQKSQNVATQKPKPKAH